MRFLTNEDLIMITMRIARKSVTLLLGIYCLICTPSIFATEKLSYICMDIEKDSLSQQWGTTDVWGRVELKIVEESNSEGLRSITVFGHVAADYDSGEQGRIDPTTAYYQGTFTAIKLVENPNYKPRRYKGYSQFRDFDASKSMSGMWGELVIERNTKKEKFQAHYIFQAGDHMGGTLHLTCSQ